MEPEITFVGSICRICLQLSLNRYDIVKSGLQYLYYEFTGINTQYTHTCDPLGSCGSTRRSGLQYFSMEWRLSYMEILYIKPDEGLPAVMCPSCVFILNKAVRFRRKCFETDFYLRDFIQSGQTEFDTENCPTTSYLTLNMADIVVCEVPSSSHDNTKVEHQRNILEDDNQEDVFMSHSVCDFEPFSVNGIKIEPEPKINDQVSPKPGHPMKRKENHCNSLEIAVANIQKDIMYNRSILEVPLNNEGNPDIKQYFGLNLGKNASIEYREKNVNTLELTEPSIEDVTIDEQCLYIMKPRYKKLSKVFKAHDGTAIYTTDLMGPKYLRIEHLTVEQQLAELETKRNSEKYSTKAYKCEPCALSFTLELQYNRHLKKHHVSAGPYQCSLCTVRYKDKYCFKHHNYSHRMRFICVICGKKLKARKFHAEHVMRKHIGLPEILCVLCNRKYKNIETFRLHNKWVHKADTHYQCPHCPQMFKKTSPNSYHTHLSKHSGKRRSFSCTSCPKSFINLFKLKLHRALTHEERKLRCKNCKGLFPFQSYLDRHMKKGCDKQFNLYQFECDQCSKVFSSRVKLNSHKAMYHEQHKFRCDTCQKTFSNEEYFKTHKSRGHEPAYCTQCDKKFGNHYDWKVHLRKTHKINLEKKIKIKRDEISRVETSFSDQQLKLLKTYKPGARHLMKVLQKKIIEPTSVSECEKPKSHFRAPQVLHVDNSPHEGEENIGCDFRNTSLSSQSESDAHSADVSNQPCYTCKYCHSIFTDYGSIYLHMEMNHAEERLGPCDESISLPTIDVNPENNKSCVDFATNLPIQQINTALFPRVPTKVIPILRKYIFRRNGNSRMVVPIEVNREQSLEGFENVMISNSIERKQQLQKNKMAINLCIKVTSLHHSVIQENQQNEGSTTAIQKQLKNVCSDLGPNVSTTSTKTGKVLGDPNTNATFLFQKSGLLIKKITKNQNQPSNTSSADLQTKQLKEVCVDGKKITSMVFKQIPKQSLEHTNYNCEKDQMLIDKNHVDLQQNQIKISPANVSSKQLKKCLIDSTSESITKDQAELISQGKLMKKNIPLIRVHADVSRKLKDLQKVDSKSKIVLEKTLRPDLMTEEDVMKLNTLIDKIQRSKPTKTVMIIKVNDVLRAFTLKTNMKKKMEISSKIP